MRRTTLLLLAAGIAFSTMAPAKPARAPAAPDYAAAVAASDRPADAVKLDESR